MNPTTPAIGDELSDERILEIAKFTQSAAPGLYGYVMAITLARAIIAADRAARPATGVPAGYWLAPMHADHWMCEAAHFGPNCAEDAMRGSDREFWEANFAAMRDSWLSRHPSPNGEDREVERDTQRLDWLQRDMLFSEPTGIAWEDGAFCFPYLVSGAGGSGGGVGMARFRSLREAIDAARAAGGEEQK